MKYPEGSCVAWGSAAFTALLSKDRLTLVTPLLTQPLPSMKTVVPTGPEDGRTTSWPLFKGIVVVGASVVELPGAPTELLRVEAGALVVVAAVEVVTEAAPLRFVAPGDDEHPATTRAKPASTSNGSFLGTFCPHSSNQVEN